MFSSYIVHYHEEAMLNALHIITLVIGSVSHQLPSLGSITSRLPPGAQGYIVLQKPSLPTRYPFTPVWREALGS
jgi:hypothetical protein